MRQAAAKREVDPNAWFQNVVSVAAEKVRQETVICVNNIHKYHIAYRPVMESQTAHKEAAEKIRGGAK